MRILGVDPGTLVVGFGCLDVQGAGGQAGSQKAGPVAANQAVDTPLAHRVANIARVARTTLTVVSAGAVRLGRSSDPDVYAAGDVASYRHPFSDRRMRLESVQNAIDQAKAVAAAIAGAEKPYTTIPWFWSDQFEFKLQMVGLSEGCDSHVQRGDMADGRFSIFHYRDGRLRAIDSVNKPADHMMGRRLLAAGLSPTPEQAADGSFPLKSLM